MKITKSMLANQFAHLCKIHNLATSKESAINQNKTEYAFLDFDKTWGGYLPVMVDTVRGTQFGFLSFSSVMPRKSLSKMYDFINECISVSQHIKDTGFGTPDKGTVKHLCKNDVITVIARRWFDKINGNTYHSVLVYVNGNYVGKNNYEYGYADQFEQSADEILQANNYFRAKDYHGLRHYNARLIRTVSDVSSKKQLAFS